MNPLNFLGVLTKPITSIVEYFSLAKEVSENTKVIKIEGAQKIVQAKIDLKLARLKAKETEISNIEDNDAAYDMQVLKNRSESIIDEFIIVAYFILIALHFVPAMQPYMLQGWKSMGYEGVPWWVEFGALGILVSTLGLMRLFRMFTNTPDKKLKSINNKT